MKSLESLPPQRQCLGVNGQAHRMVQVQITIVTRSMPEEWEKWF
jgi:hypothetical protein